MVDFERRLLPAVVGIGLLGHPLVLGLFNRLQMFAAWLRLGFLERQMSLE